MLEAALTRAFAPGTNVKHDMVSADWRFLLPNLELDTVACCGVPALSTLSVLTTMAREVILVSTKQPQLQATKEACRSRQLTNVRFVHTTDFCDIQLPQGSLDLVYFVDRHTVHTLLQDKRRLVALCQMIHPHGTIYVEFTGLLDRPLRAKMLSNLAACGFNSPQLFHLAPALGRRRAANAMHDTATTQHFINTLYSPSVKHQLLKYVGTLLGTYPCAVVAQRHVAGRTGQPPTYLVSLSSKADICVDDYRWGLAMGGRYNSKKILFTLFDRTSGKAEVIVKLTRSATFNSRLENEYHALVFLHESRLVEPGTVPQPLFLDYHNGLAVLGQKVIHGQSFQQRTTADANCPLLGTTMQWLTDLGARTADTQSATPSQVAAGMSQLFEQCRQIYTLSRSHQDFLVEQIETMRTSDTAFPLVFMHGDAGTWNVLAIREHHTALLDWEAAELHGIPLWDLFYFLKTYGSLISRMSHTKDTLKGFTKQFLTPTRISTLLVEATHTYCDRLRLDKRMIESLFYTCWMYRSLKEAMRLPRSSLENGHYINLLRLTIEHRHTPALENLFSLR